MFLWVWWLLKPLVNLPSRLKGGLLRFLRSTAKVCLQKGSLGDVPPSHLCALIKMSEEHTRWDFFPLPRALALSLWIRWLSRRLRVEKDIKIFLALSSLCVLSRPQGKTKMLLSRVGSFQEIKHVGQGRSSFSGTLMLQQFSWSVY